MNFVATLSKLEEEYLIRASESAIYVRELRQFFLWAQGQLQGLLPHRAMVCIQFGSNDEVLQIQSLDGAGREAGFMQRLCERDGGLAVQLARFGLANGPQACIIAADTNNPKNPCNALHAELVRNELDNVMVHGTGHLRDGFTAFILFSMPKPPSERDVYFFELLMPYMHLAFQRIMSTNASAEKPQHDVGLLTSREMEVLAWVIKGKSNAEIGEIVHLSHLTVKNHLQNIYRKLGVHNRMQAISRCYSLQLLGPK